MGRETSTENKRRGDMQSIYMYMYLAIKRRGGVYCSQYCTPPRCREVVWYCKEPILDLYDRQGRLGLLQALAHTPPVDVTVTVIVILFSYPFCV